MNDSFFKKIENKTGVPMEEVFALANAIQHADFKNENQVRKIIQNVGSLANKNVPQHLEDELVNSLISSGQPLNLAEIQRMIGRT